jgi:hypothetical protein
MNVTSLDDDGGCKQGAEPQAQLGRIESQQRYSHDPASKVQLLVRKRKEIKPPRVLTEYVSVKSLIYVFYSSE